MAAILEAHLRVLLGVDVALLLEQTGGLQAFQVAHQTVLEFGIVHGKSGGEIKISARFYSWLIVLSMPYSGRMVCNTKIICLFFEQIHG